MARRYGVTDPISTAHPSASDKASTRRLAAFARDNGLHETAEGVERRLRALAKLGSFVHQWGVLVSGEAGMAEAAKVPAFGAAKAGMARPSIDATPAADGGDEAGSTPLLSGDSKQVPS